MNFETSQLGKFVIKLSLGFVVTANFSTLALPASAQQDQEFQEVCKSVVAGVVYASKPPLSLEVYKSSAGPSPYFAPSSSNIKSVTSYSAKFAKMSDDPYAPRINFPAGYTISNYSATGACGFDTSGKLVALRITSANIWRSLKDFQDYGKVQDFGQLIVFRRGIRANETNSAVKAFNVIANGKRETWVANCRSNQVERSIEQPIKQNTVTASISKYICTQ
jgi:hypothetical protein